MLCGEERSVVVLHFPPGGLTTKHFSGAHTYTKPHTQTQKFRKYTYILHTTVFTVNFFPPPRVYTLCELGLWFICPHHLISIFH